MTKRKIKQELTPEQLVIHNLEKLQLSEGWEYIVSQLQADKEILIEQLKQQSKKARDIHEISDVNYLANKIELMEDMILLPKRMTEELDPIIETQTPE